MEYLIHSSDGELYHHGIKGQKWGVRRFQNADGSLTAAGAKRKLSREERKLRKYLTEDGNGYTKKGEKRYQQMKKTADYYSRTLHKKIDDNNALVDTSKRAIEDLKKNGVNSNEYKLWAEQDMRDSFERYKEYAERRGLTDKQKLVGWSIEMASVYVRQKQNANTTIRELTEKHKYNIAKGKKAAERYTAVLNDMSSREYDILLGTRGIHKQYQESMKKYKEEPVRKVTTTRYE